MTHDPTNPFQDRGELKRELGKFCQACQAIPAFGYCHLAGCPTSPVRPPSSAKQTEGDSSRDDLDPLSEAEKALEPFSNVASRFLDHELPLDHRGVALSIPLGAASQGRTGADLEIGCANQLLVEHFRLARTVLAKIKEARGG